MDLSLTPGEVKLGEMDNIHSGRHRGKSCLSGRARICLHQKAKGIFKEVIIRCKGVFQEWKYLNEWQLFLLVSLMQENLKNKRRKQNLGNDVKPRTKEKCQCFELERYTRILFSIVRDYQNRIRDTWMFQYYLRPHRCSIIMKGKFTPQLSEGIPLLVCDKSWGALNSLFSNQFRV